MTKEELIKQAFEIGWSFYHECATDLDYEEALVYCLDSLNNNNGWIKIESENDLPKEDTHCLIMFQDLSYSIDLFYKEGGFLRNHWRHILYYQPIEKPKPPIKK